ncbi:MAG: hypothetical protein J6K52_03185 [Clostridia bacterium]|nr:hypothetical protein [Clostridia bacterium]
MEIVFDTTGRLKEEFVLELIKEREKRERRMAKRKARQEAKMKAMQEAQGNEK